MNYKLKNRLSELKRKSSIYLLPWQKCFFPKKTIYPNSYSKDHSKLYLTDFSIGENLGRSDELAPRSVKHSGWYVDEYQEETLSGYVVKLRSAKGTYYIPATKQTDCDVVTYYLSEKFLVPKGAEEYDHESTILMCAKEADECARIEAEKQRDYNAKYQAEQQYQDNLEEVEAHNAELRRLEEELQGTTLPPSILLAVQARISDLENRIEAIEEENENLKQDYSLEV